MREKLMQIARTAGEFFSARSLSRIDQKEGHANFVTNIDREVEEYLQQALLSLVPGSRIIGEEKENDALTDAPTWIVDPVDGTTNLIHDYRCSAVSIALCENRSPVAGLIWQPYTQEMFYAEAGRGASLNGKEIHVSETPFDKALIAVGTAPYHAELAEKSMELALAFLHSCADIRRSGSAAVDLAYLAAGRLDAFFELNLKPWDYAAGSLIVREAGGVVTMPLEPGEMRYDRSTAILASGAVIAEEVRAVFDRHTGRIR
ncbi:MAG: inositol monophosphatase [Clostridiales bacterium]|nr:inositol monophosphatase [Clostridiales bacterium]